MHADSKKRRSFLALLFAAGDAKRWTATKIMRCQVQPTSVDAWKAIAPRYVTAVFVTSMLLGCAGFTYDGITYRTRTEAVDAARRDLRSIAELVRPVSGRLKGAATVLIPDRQRIQEKAVVTTGAVSADQVAYVVDILQLGYLGMAQALEQAQLFESVEIRESYDPASAKSSTDWVVLFDLKDKDTAQWYLRRESSREQIAVPVDLGADRRLRRTDAWVASLRAAALSLDGRDAVAAGDSNDRSLPHPARTAAPQTQVSSGTAFVVAPGAYLVSNYHVTSGCSRVTTVDEGQLVDLAVVSEDEENDLVVLKGAVRQQAASLSADPVRHGQRVVAMGFPLRGLLASRATVSEGIIANVSGPRNDVRLLQTSTPVQPGNSGGPLLDECGHVVGIVVGKLDALKVAVATGDIPQNVNFAIKQAVVSALLDAARVGYRAARCDAPLPISQISQIGEESVVPIDCWR